MQYPSEPIVHFTLMSVLAALEECGCLDEIKKNRDGITAKELSQRLSLNSSVLVELLNFITINSPAMLGKNKDCYCAGPLLSNPIFKNSFYFFLAYKPVLFSLTPLLKRELVYGRDLQRRGEYLYRSSALYNAPAYKTVLDILEKIECDIVVDLGCGRGDFLIQMHQRFSAKKGLGIEIDENVVTISHEMMSSEGLDKSIKIIEGDAKNPEAWKHNLGKISPSRCVFIGITLWHEFLFKGVDALYDILKQYRLYFPRGTFIAVEYNGFSTDDLLTLPFNRRGMASLYQMVHPLTNQGTPLPISAWQDIFHNSGVVITNTVPTGENSTVYVGTLMPLKAD